MRLWTILVSLIVGCLVAGNSLAQQNPPKKHHWRDRFEKMDTNHDGILTVQEFVAAHPKIGPEKATKFYNDLAALGGTTTKDGATGMTLPQFRKGHIEWNKAHPHHGQKPPDAP